MTVYLFSCLSRTPSQKRSRRRASRWESLLCWRMMTGQHPKVSWVWLLLWKRRSSCKIFLTCQQHLLYSLDWSTLWTSSIQRIWGIHLKLFRRSSWSWVQTFQQGSDPWRTNSFSESTFSLPSFQPCSFTLLRLLKFCTYVLSPALLQFSYIFLAFKYGEH